MARLSKKLESQNKDDSYMQKLSNEADANQSRISWVLGALILIVLGVLIFNYFSARKASLGPAQETQMKDVSPQNLPGKYTVKEGDTLFLIAQKYYNDGYKYEEISKANKLSNPDLIEKDEVLEIPKLVEAEQWGPKIVGETYTVSEGDWLSKIAARAYGDIMAYPKIAQANNIPNPDLIHPGQVLKIPR